MIGLPSNYSAYILKGLAYDDNNVYQINLGVQLGNRSGFYGAEVNFNGKTPMFSRLHLYYQVVFLLMNQLQAFTHSIIQLTQVSHKMSLAVT